jgi:hypothetical protein
MGKSRAPVFQSKPSPQAIFFGVSALLFAASAVGTIVWCASMSAMGEMPMPGGWTMSMAWMRMPGQTWPGAAASFLGMIVASVLVAIGWRWTPAVGTLLAGGILMGNPFLLRNLSYPSRAGFFLAAVTQVISGLLVVGAGIGATLQNYRKKN